MQTIRVNGVEIQFEDGLAVSIENEGRRIVVRGRAVTEVVRFVPVPYPVAPYAPPINPIFTQPYPNTTPWTPFITCGASSADSGLQ